MPYEGRYRYVNDLAKKSVRAAQLATAMLGCGQTHLDVELKSLREEADRLLGRMEESAFREQGDRARSILLLRLGGGLRRVEASALDAAVLLRGKSIRVWMLFDRVRMSAALTERLASLLACLPDRGGRPQPLRALGEFREECTRLAVLEERFYESPPALEQGASAIMLSTVLGFWRHALEGAFEATRELLLS